MSMRLVPPPPEPPDDADSTANTPFEPAVESLSGIRSQPIPPLHRVFSHVLVMNAAHLQYVAANVYASQDKDNSPKDKGK